MKKYCLFTLVLVTFLLSGIFSTNAQTNVTKLSATKTNDYGVEYVLPKTVLKINIEYSETTQKAGQYAKYAEKYLGIKEADIITEDGVFYTLDKVNVEGVGVPDKDATYLIELKSRSTAPFIYVKENGLICTINAEYTPEPEEQKTQLNRQERNTVKIDPQSIFTEEYLRAGSVSKMAEVLTKQIFRIRDSRNDILTGEAENVPRDGEGIRIVLANLEAQEKALMELFTGSSVSQKKQAQFELEPQSDIFQEVIFRFSKFGGVVDADDLSGSPVYINVNTIEKPEDISDSKKKQKEEKSITYNVPAIAQVEVYFGTQNLFSSEIPICQFGKKQILATTLFEDRKAPVQVFFHPNTGGIKQIKQ